MGYIDIEDALQRALNAAGFTACAKPLPHGFACPHVLVDLLNAADDNAAQAVYNVDFDCRAQSYADAAQLQIDVSGFVRSLVGSELDGKPVYAVDTLRLQRAQPDQSHKDTIIATVSAELRVRVAD